MLSKMGFIITIAPMNIIEIKSYEKNHLEFNGSRQFCSWLIEQHISLSFSTYQAGKLFFIGMQDEQKMSVFERTFARCMGMGLDPKTHSLWVANLYQLWRFENALKPGQDHQGYDRVYVPQVGYTTGDVDAHDVAVDDGCVVCQYIVQLFGSPQRNPQL